MNMAVFCNWMPYCTSNRAKNCEFLLYINSQIHCSILHNGESGVSPPTDITNQNTRRKVNKLPEYMVSFSPGWNFAPPTGLKYCCDYMLNISPGAKRKFPRENIRIRVKAPSRATLKAGIRKPESGNRNQNTGPGIRNWEWWQKNSL